MRASWFKVDTISHDLMRQKGKGSLNNRVTEMKVMWRWRRKWEWCNQKQINSHQELEETKNESPLDLLEGMRRDCQHCDFGLWILELWGFNFCFITPLNLWYFVSRYRKVMHYVNSLFIEVLLFESSGINSFWDVIWCSFSFEWKIKILILLF